MKAVPRIRVTAHSGREFAYKLASAQTTKKIRDDFRKVIRDFCRWDHPTKSYIGAIDDFPRFVTSASSDFLLDINHAILLAVEKRVLAIREQALSLDQSLRCSELFDYQKEGVSFLAGRTAAGLFDDMGLGKTVQSIMAIPSHATEPCAPTIIVCPASVKGVWIREIKKWRPAITKVYVISGRGNFVPPSPGEVMILNYEIQPDFDELEAMQTENVWCPGTILIGDEIHACKSPKARRTRDFRALREAITSHGGQVWGLSGTPLLNHGKELKEVTKTLGIFTEAFGTDKDFASLFDGYYTENGKWVADYYSPQPELAECLSAVSLRRHKKDVLKQLPDKIYGTPIIADPPTGEIAAICDEALESDLVQQALESLTSDKQEFGMGALAIARKALATCKIPKLLEIIEEEYEATETPVVIFSAHRAPIDMLAKRPGWITVTGSTSPAKRAQIEDDFQAGKYKGIAGTIRAMSEGMTLTYASHVLFVDLDWTPARNTQASDRVCRIGQKNAILIRTLIADHPLDIKVMECLIRKQAAFDKSVNQLPHYQQEETLTPTGGGSLLYKQAEELAMIAGLLEAHI